MVLNETLITFCKSAIALLATKYLCVILPPVIVIVAWVLLRCREGTAQAMLDKYKKNRT